MHDSHASSSKTGDRCAHGPQGNPAVAGRQAGLVLDMSMLQIKLKTVARLFWFLLQEGMRDC